MPAKIVRTLAGAKKQAAATLPATSAPPAASPIVKTIELIRVRYQCRTTWHRAEKALTLQARSLCLRHCDNDLDKAAKLFDAMAALNDAAIAKALAQDSHPDPLIANALPEVYPLLVARQGIKRARSQIERDLENLALELPVMSFVKATHSFGPGSLAAIIGNAGNLWNYPTIRKLWKRMGLAVMPDGRRQRNLRGPNDVDRAGYGYSPERRSVMWNIGSSMLRGQSARKVKDESGAVIEITRPAGPYRIIFDQRYAYETEKNERGDYAHLIPRNVTRTLNNGDDDSPKGEVLKAYRAGRLPRGHIKNRAQRFMEKTLLKALWTEWRRCMGEAKPSEAEILAASTPRPRTAKPKRKPHYGEEESEVQIDDLD